MEKFDRERLCEQLESTMLTAAHGDSQPLPFNKALLMALAGNIATVAKYLANTHDALQAENTALRKRVKRLEQGP